MTEKILYSILKEEVEKGIEEFDIRRIEDSIEELKIKKAIVYKDEKKIYNYIHNVFELEEGMNKKTREPKYVWARYSFAWYLRKVKRKKSLASIGRELGGKDHATILHGVRNIEEIHFTNRFYSEVTHLKNILLCK